MAQAAELVTQAIAPLATRLEELGQTNTQLAQRLQQPPPDPPKDTGGGDDDFLTRFSNDPEGAIRTLATEPIKEAAPLIMGLINSTVGNFVARETEKVDREFGPGAWDKFFDKPLSTIMDSYRQSNAPALAESGTIRREVDGLKGKMFEELVLFREESRKAATNTEQDNTKKLVDGVTENVIQQTNLTGGLRRVGGAEEEVTEAVKGYIAERTAAIGGDEKPKDFLARTDYGNSIEDYYAHQKKLDAAKGGTQ
jgi:hypothetical protein